MMTKALNYVDLCFVIDTTGSMGSFIQAAKQQLLDTIQLLSADSEIDLQVANAIARLGKRGFLDKLMIA